MDQHLGSIYETYFVGVSKWHYVWDYILCMYWFGLEMPGTHEFHVTYSCACVIIDTSVSLDAYVNSCKCAGQFLRVDLQNCFCMAHTHVNADTCV